MVGSPMGCTGEAKRCNETGWRSEVWWPSRAPPCHAHNARQRSTRAHTGTCEAGARASATGGAGGGCACLQGARGGLRQAASGRVQGHRALSSCAGCGGRGEGIAGWQGGSMVNRLRLLISHTCLGRALCTAVLYCSQAQQHAVLWQLQTAPPGKAEQRACRASQCNQSITFKVHGEPAEASRVRRSSPGVKVGSSWTTTSLAAASASGWLGSTATWSAAASAGGSVDSSTTTSPAGAGVVSSAAASASARSLGEVVLSGVGAEPGAARVRFSGAATTTATGKGLGAVAGVGACAGAGAGRGLGSGVVAGAGAGAGVKRALGPSGEGAGANRRSGLGAGAWEGRDAGRSGAAAATKRGVGFSEAGAGEKGRSRVGAGAEGRDAGCGVGVEGRDAGLGAGAGEVPFVAAAGGEDCGKASAQRKFRRAAGATACPPPPSEGAHLPVPSARSGTAGRGSRGSGQPWLRRR